MKALIITVAGIGAELSKRDTPYLPITPDEIANEAARIANLGAQIFHLHVRDNKGRPTIDPKCLKEVISKIRKKNDLIIQVSTGGDISDSFAQRIKTLEAKPEMASLTLGSVNFGNQVFLNPLPFVEELARTMKKKKIHPELEIFDVGMIDTAFYLIKKGLLDTPLHFNVILGGRGWLSASEENLEFIIKKLPKGSTWSASGVGRFQLPMIEYAVEHGGHVRTGLEDNIYIRKGVLAKGNAELVEEVLKSAKKYKRKIATIAEARRIVCPG